MSWFMRAGYRLNTNPAYCLVSLSQKRSSQSMHVLAGRDTKTGKPYPRLQVFFRSIASANYHTSQYAILGFAV